MGLSTAMQTGLSGLNVNQTRIETTGHNIANVNTTAYKGSRTLFQTQFARTLSMGTQPSADSGGTNPMQVGLGAVVGSTQRTFNGGALETTGIAGDLAVEGAGYFAVDDPSGRRFYTRDGSFSLNSDHQLVSMDGYKVQGYGVDGNFAVNPGTLQGLTIPVGELSIANTTSNVIMDGDLSAAATAATAGSQHSSQAFVDGGGNAAAAATRLSDLRSAAASGTVLFADGDVITVSGITKGGRSVTTQQFTVGTTGSTLDDLATWLENSLGIQDVDGVPGDPGVVIENGALVIRANAGQPNTFAIDNSQLVSSNAGSPLPFTFAQDSASTGTGVYTSFTVYDSLGNPVNVNATFTLEGTPDTGPVWRYYLESPDSGASSRVLGTGTATFNTNGAFVSATGNQFSIDRTGTGAASPLSFTMDMASLNGLSTQTSTVIMADQDGFPPGILSGFGVETDGRVQGVFSNGMERTLGQLALATFRNEAGLVAETDNLYTIGPNSGAAAITTPGTLAAGTVRSGALEMSNVDLSREFIQLITSSTGFQANSRVITVASDLLDNLLMALR